MSFKKLLIKTSVKLIILVVISVIAFNILLSPVITNEMAMTQMENSNELFMMYDTYNKISPIVTVVYWCAFIYLMGTIVYDVYKFLKEIL